MHALCTMNKLFAFTLLLLANSTVWAQCSSSQQAAALELDVKHIPAGTAAGGNHEHMDKIIIQAPIELAGMYLSGMELTEGEVANFWVPLAYEVKGAIASSIISGYKEAIENFEVAVYYGDSNCQRSILRSLR